MELIDNEEDIEPPGQLLGWLLIECDTKGGPTGRALGGLHESILGCDPRNIEGEGIRGF